jgi:hypothetical protein
MGGCIIYYVVPAVQCSQWYRAGPVDIWVHVISAAENDKVRRPLTAQTEKCTVQPIQGD